MKSLKEFEVKVIRLLLQGILLSEQIDEILQNNKFVDYEYTGSGYFLSITHQSLTEKRIVCSRPIVVGKTQDGIVSGFVLFIENKVLTIECHSWGEINIPEDFRKRNIEISIGDFEQNN